MAKSLQDTVLLDPRQYNRNTRKWNVPILSVRGLEVHELHIDGNPVLSGDYSVDNNMISLSDKYDVTDDTDANLIIMFRPTNMLLVFWLPIIIAIIGLLGTISQPILYNFQLLYQPELEIYASSWGYDYDNHRFDLTLLLRNTSKSDKRDWEIYLGVRELDSSVDPKHATYKYVAGPFTLHDSMKISASTDADFTKKITANSSFVQGVFFKVKKGTYIDRPFSPREYGEKSVVFIGGVGQQK